MKPDDPVIEAERREKLKHSPAFQAWLKQSSSRAAAILRTEQPDDSTDALDRTTSFDDVDGADLLVNGLDETD